jgi:glycine cleavage system H protein
VYPENLKYTKEHEWLQAAGGNRAKVGITYFAQKELGDVVFVDLPVDDAEVTVGNDFAVVESVKAVSDIYAPVSGKIVEVNQELVDHPELINEDPYGRGWIAIIEMSDPSQKDALLSVTDYKEHVGESYEPRRCNSLGIYTYHRLRASENARYHRRVI